MLPANSTITFYSDLSTMIFLQRLWITLYSVLLGGALYAQTEQIRFEHITSAQGLSENVINCMYQDSQGFLWIGTNDGLNRYDGYNFTTYPPIPDDERSINSNLIYAITEDLSGHIWIGTTGSGLNRFDPRTEIFTHLRRRPGQANSLSSDQIVSLLTDGEGRIWVGTINGLNVIFPKSADVDTLTVRPISIEHTTERFVINEIIEDQAGNIWIGTNGGLYRCEARNLNGVFHFERIRLGPGVSTQVKALEIDQYGRLLLGTPTGLYYQTPTGEEPTFVKFSDFAVHAIVLEGADGLWVGTYRGLLQFNVGERNQPPRLKAKYNAELDDPYSLNKNVIKSLLRDRTGMIWVGTVGGGLNKFDPRRKSFYHFGRKLSNKGNHYTEVRALLEDSFGNLWVGTEGGGLFRNAAGGTWQHYDEFVPVEGSASVFALEEVVENGRHVLYVGSEDTPTLRRIEISATGPVQSEVVADMNGSVFTILQDKKDNLWIGTYNIGLWRWIRESDGQYRKELFNQQNSALASNIIRKLYEDADGNIWIGTAKGLNKIVADDASSTQPTFQLFRNVKNNPNSLSHDYILDIFQSSSGYLWIGTFGGGLNQLVQNDERSTVFKRFMESDGLPNNTVKGILEDQKGDLWLATNGGMSKFSPTEEVFDHYSTSDGLQSAEFFEGAKFQRRDGALLFGGVNGFNAFFPEEIRENEMVPEVLFTRLTVNNEEVQPGEKIKNKVILTQSISLTQELSLAYGQNDFSVEFAALHYADPKKNRYAYKLVGYHQDWIQTDAEKRFATFTNLPHGHYRLLVKAANADGVWMEKPTVLKLQIQPPFWLSWPAYLLYGLLMVAGLWLFRRYTVISVHEKHRLMLEHMEREKLEELNQMKLRFFTNISHELRTPLTLIISPLELILEKGRSLSSDQLQQQHHYIYKNAKYLLRLVNQLLDFRKLDQGSMNLRVDQGDVLAFISDVTEPFQFLAGKKAIRFEVNHADSSIYSYFDPDVLEKIMYNLLSNAFKFTPSGGAIQVTVRERERKDASEHGAFLEIMVRDNGVGIAQNQLKKIFERFHKEEEKKMNKDGAGIGLAYTKSLVELHRGSIRVESVKGKGACFIVSMPMSKKDYLKSEIERGKIEQFEVDADPLDYLVAEPPAQLPDPAAKIQEPEESLPLLLFVDDNSDIRQFIKDGFQNDFRIILAEDGEKAHEIALSSLPDVIVSDIMMPNMDGIELCETLKNNPLTSHIPIVLLTAKSADEDELEGLRTGADAYVVKPFKLDILRAKLLNIYYQRERLKRRFRQEVLLQPEDITVTSADEEFLKRAVTIIEDHMSESEFNVEALVKEMHLSRSKLYLKLKALTGQSSSEFIRTIRLKRAVQLLEKSDYTIKEIMFMTGFNTASYFSKCFKNQFGVVPSDYLRRQSKAEVQDV